MSKIEGVISYTIGRNGCLNGFYANDGKDRAGEVFNEIAKKEFAITKLNEILGEPRGAMWDLKGDYTAVWIELDDIGRMITTQGHLNIDLNNGVYSLKWTVKGQVKFTGIGFLTGDNQLTVKYTNQ